MFSCSVQEGRARSFRVSTYRGTPDSKLLEQEVIKRLSVAANPKFFPAVYNHLPVDAIYLRHGHVQGGGRETAAADFFQPGTEELKKESDFVGPQPFWGGESKFNGFALPEQE